MDSMLAPSLNESIVEATPNDFTTMSKVITECLQRVNSKDYPPEVIQNLVDLHSPEKIGAYLSTKYAVVLKRQGQIIGTGALDGDEITTVFVLPDFHRQGIGRRIMEVLEAVAGRRGIGTVQLHASLTSIRFYEALGYRHVEDVEREVGGRSVVMSKPTAMQGVLPANNLT